MKYWRTCSIGHWGISDEEMDSKRTLDGIWSIQSVPVLLRTVICSRSDLPEAVHTRFAGYTGCRVCVHGSDSLDLGGIQLMRDNKWAIVLAACLLMWAWVLAAILKIGG